MTIVKNNKEATIEPGQFVLFEPLSNHRICSQPLEVTRVAGQHIYHLDRHGDPERGHRLRKTAVFICDTKEEGEQIYALSKEYGRRITESIKAIDVEFESKISALIKKP